MQWSHRSLLDKCGCGYITPGEFPLHNDRSSIHSLSIYTEKEGVLWMTAETLPEITNCSQREPPKYEMVCCSWNNSKIKSKLQITNYKLLLPKTSIQQRVEYFDH
jgi:hypothetical protein